MFYILFQASKTCIVKPRILDSIVNIAFSPKSNLADRFASDVESSSGLSGSQSTRAGHQALLCSPVRISIISFKVRSHDDSEHVLRFDVVPVFVELIGYFSAPEHEVSVASKVMRARNLHDHSLPLSRLRTL